MTKKSQSANPARSGPRQANPEGYTVGPGFPPYHSRFEKDAPSPNPGGRPPKKKQEALMKSFDTFHETVSEHGAGKMPLYRDGETVQVTRLDAFLDFLFKQAAKGNAKALGLYMAAQKEAAEAKRSFSESILLAAVEYQERWLLVFLLNERQNKPMPVGIYPDPRDIVINPDGSVQIVGPISLQQHLLLEEIVQVRDEAFDIYDGLLKSLKSTPIKLKRVWREGNKVLKKWNDNIPPRLQTPLPALETYLR